MTYEPLLNPRAWKDHIRQETPVVAGTNNDGIVRISVFCAISTFSGYDARGDLTLMGADLAAVVSVPNSDLQMLTTQ